MKIERVSAGHQEQESPLDRRNFLKGILASAGVFTFSPDLHSLIRSGAVSDRSIARSVGNSPTGSAMVAAARQFLNSLNAEQRSRIMFSLDDELRLDWNYRPRVDSEFRQRETDSFRREFLDGLPMPKGVALKELDPRQKRLASNLLRSGLSRTGINKATGIMALQNVVREIDRGYPVWDSEAYNFCLFGDLQSKKSWAWSLEGHHLSLNYTLVEGRSIASTPSFFGALPAEVADGPRKGLRVLRDEEDLARALLKMLEGRQRSQAVISESAPRDILSGVLRKADSLTPAGVKASELGQQQVEVLMKLLRVYAMNMPAEISASRLDKLRAASLNNISFAWAGSPQRGQPHYYRIQGKSFLIEYDNIQNNANHIHTVWRDFDGDFGLDLLANHYRQAHR